RAYGVALAIKNLGYDSKLIAYSDDLDGLRKIPSGLPEWLRDYIGKPVSNIPDPIGQCHDSYGSHMSSLLLDALDRLEISYKFLNAAKVYGNGMLTNQIDIILSHAPDLGNMIEEIVGQSKYKESLPYFPICESCGRLYVAHAEKYIREEKKVSYICNGTKLGNKDVKGCGYTGEIPISAGKGKLAWKVEFAARWSSLDIRFEAYGKDIMDSVRVNDWVADEILEFPHPFHVKYEMFLDKSGKKISKSAGNVLTPQMWLRYGTPESILLLLFKRITGTRHVGLDDVPALMREYDEIEDVYFGKTKEGNPAKLTKTRGLYEYIHKLDPPKDPGPHIPYKLIAQQAAIFPPSDDRSDKIFQRLVKYGMVKNRTDAIIHKIMLASNWADDNSSAQDERYEVQLSDVQRRALNELLQALKPFSGLTDTQDNAKNLQSKVFDVARNNGMEPREFFTLLYRMFLNADRGPRIGNYFLDLGIGRTTEVLERYLN
ncbi:MAG TPA: lysine--tRNA ligase, partial [Nitrososphaera sp.]|nr:lysine--tRNA ligase [Nitrososphaera sp.]